MPTTSIASMMSQFSKKHFFNGQPIEKFQRKIPLSHHQSKVLSRLCQDLGDIVFYEDEALLQVSLEYLRVIVSELNKFFRREEIPISIENYSGKGYCLRLSTIVPTATTGHDTPSQGISEKSQDCLLTESAPLADTRPLKTPEGTKEIESEVLQCEEDEVVSLPRTTEVERRHGQERFREKLIDYWRGRCPLTGINNEGLLRASHIRPWADCRTSTQRLDVYNGLLLSPLWDMAFDQGLVTFDEDGWPRFSDSLSDTDQAHFQLGWRKKPIPLECEHQAYLDWHRKKIFRKPQK